MPSRSAITSYVFVSLMLFLSPAVVYGSSLTNTTGLNATVSSLETIESKNGSLFPQPVGIRPNVNFWVDVYTKYKNNEAIVHDSRDLDIRYEVIDLNLLLGPKASWKAKNRFLNKRKKHYARLLRKLAKRGGKCTSTEECRVAALFGPNPEGRALKKASRSVRTQYGLAGRFRRGIEVSGIHLDRMRDIFSSYGLPEELLVLPHVESSFNLKAYSKYGAAGIWQFTRSTGRLFLKINYSIDERRDPILSTHAAAKLLMRNYQDLKSWPLAITAYNHGRVGMLRAKKRFGNDIAGIVDRYKSRSFGFASRNFYAEFLAALKIMEDPEKYFVNINYETPLYFDTVKLKDFISAKALSRHFKYDKSDMVALNPALRRPVWKGGRYIPKNYSLRVPYGTAQMFESLYEELPSGMRFRKQVMPDWYRVRRGDSLSVIAKRFRTTIAALQNYNNLGNRHRIYAGQKLRIPSGKYRKAKKNEITLAMKTGKAKQIQIKKNSPALKKEVSAKPKILAALPDEMKAEKRVTELTVSSVTLFSVPIEAPPLSRFELEYFDDETGLLRVQPEETLGHYSHWAGLSTMELRRLNGWTRRRQIHLGQKIMVPLVNVTKERFESLRYEYQLSIFEDFFAAYSVDRVETVAVRKGQSLWTLCNDEYDVPLWLVRLYNQGRPLENLQPGQELRIPIVEKRNL